MIPLSFLCLAVAFWCLPVPVHAEEYSFDISEVEKRPYHLGGYLEISPSLFKLDRDAALYKLKFYSRDEGSAVEEFNASLQLEGSYETGISRLFIKTNTAYNSSYLGDSQKTVIYEGYLSLKPSSSLTVDIGKKTLKWGKGYAWNPVAFIDRPKNPDDPELSLEGFIVVSADYIKSLGGPLKTISLTPVIIPVSRHVNDSYGAKDGLIFAGRLYLLLYDTDIDFIALAGTGKTARYGMDFSRNITTNFEIHGEFAFINDFRKVFIDGSGVQHESVYDAKSFLLGIRYLTEKDTTYILEYYRNGTGFGKDEMMDYFSYIYSGFSTFYSAGDDSGLRRAASLTEGNYGRMNPMRDYFYLRVSQKEPFDILYFTPSVTGILNLADRSFSLTPELLYTGVTNLELRLRTTFIAGGRYSEFGEKQNDFRADFRARYYF